MKCDHCDKDLGILVVYDHGRRYHPDCYEPAFEKRQRESEKKLGKDDWQKGLYET